MAFLLAFEFANTGFAWQHDFGFDSCWQQLFFIVVGTTLSCFWQQERVWLLSDAVFSDAVRWTLVTKNFGGTTLFASAQAIFCESVLQQQVSQQRAADLHPQGEFSHGNLATSPFASRSIFSAGTIPIGIGSPSEMVEKTSNRQHETHLVKRDFARKFCLLR